MRVRIKVEREKGGRWCATSTGVRGFGVSPVLGDTRQEAVARARAAVRFGVSCAVDEGRYRRPPQVTFVAASNGHRRPAPRRAPRASVRLTRSTLQLLAP